MLGTRGCRLGIIFPEIPGMQSRAIFEAACGAKLEGIDVMPEVMIPLVGFVTELKRQEQIVRSVATTVFREKGIKVRYLVGTMIELPRAAITADEIAGVAEFFSFGTNDLTQTTLGLSRDDAGTFLPQYVERGIIADDPFQTIDRGRRADAVCRREGAVGEPVVENRHLRGTRRGTEVGEILRRPRPEYVSRSPFRLPIARLAAAQAGPRPERGGAAKRKRKNNVTDPDGD